MRYNGNKFSVYESEEKTVLGLLGELGSQVNHNTEDLEKVKESDNKKVSHDEMNTIYKIDKNADFIGSWHGIKKPTASQEGLQATVDKIVEEDIPSINEQLETNTHKIAYISKFEEADKWLLLKQLMDKYDEIIIDEDITINCNDIYLLNKDIKISGNCKITVISDNLNVIKINKSNLSININGVSLDLQNKGYFISGNGENGYLSIDIEKIKIENCNISGKGVLLCLYINKTDINKVTVKNTIIKNNNINNLEMQFIHTPDDVINFQLYGLFVIENISIENIICENNNIRNTSRSIFQFKGRNKSNKRDNIIIKNNILINDDNCFGNHTTYFIYYVFAIAESDNVTYENNYVEGLKLNTKTPGGYGGVVYDLYCDGDNITYKNNVSKNNIAFYEFDDLTPNNNFLIKCKGAINVRYSNNKFIIDEEFILKHTTSEVIRKNDFKIIDYSSETFIPNRNWIIENNQFIAPYLCFESEGNDCRNLIYKNNEIKCNTIWGAIFSLNSNDGRIREFKNNTIIAKHGHDKNPLNLFRSYSVDNNEVFVNSIMEFNGNTIIADNFNKYSDYNQLTDTQLRYQEVLRFDKLIIKNNIFSNNLDNLRYIKSSLVLDNNIYLNNNESNSINYGLDCVSLSSIKIIDNISLKTSNSFRVSLMPDKSSNKKGYILLKVYKKDGTIEEQLFNITLSATESWVDDTSSSTEGCDITVTKGNLKCELYHGDWNTLKVYTTSNNIIKAYLEISLN